MTFLSKTIGRLALGLGLAVPLVVAAPQQTKADSNPFIGELMLVGENFCPRSWADADGQLLAISSYDALFSLLGCQYGGDCRTTFALPDLRGRVPIHTGTGAGLPTYDMASRGGTTGFTLTVAQLPSHNHNVQAVAQLSNKGGPGNDFLGIPDHYKPNSPNDPISIYHDGAPDAIMDTRMLTNTGGNLSVGHRGPYLTMRWCVALFGVYPSRN